MTLILFFKKGCVCNLIDWLDLGAIRKYCILPFPLPIRTLSVKLVIPLLRIKILSSLHMLFNHTQRG